MIQPRKNAGNHVFSRNLSTRRAPHILNRSFRNGQTLKPLLGNGMVDCSQVANKLLISNLGNRRHSLSLVPSRATFNKLHRQNYRLSGAVSSLGANRAPKNSSTPLKTSVTSVTPSPIRKSVFPEIAPMICGENVSPSR